MFTPIDLTTWPRRDHFAYYRARTYEGGRPR